MLMAGKSVPVSKQDDDEDHLAKMEPMLARFRDFPMYARTAVMEHYAMHIQQMEQKQAEQKAQQRQAMQQQMLTGGMPGVDKPPQPGGMEARTKAQQPGITPGPQQDRTVARTGRSGSGLSQTQAMSA